MTSEVSLYTTPEKSFKLGVALQAYITGLNQNEAEELVAKAHEVCPYSNAIRGHVDVKLSVSVK